MTEPAKSEDELVRVLASFDDALAGSDPAWVAVELPRDWDGELAARLDRAQGCLRELESLWPRRRSGADSQDTQPPADQTARDALGLLPPGAMLGDYRIAEPLGAGGMGLVYRAEHCRMKRSVALKLLSPHVVWSPTARQRFEREVHAIAQLHHPNIVTAYDAREDNGVFYFVMELVQGVDLGELVKKNGPLPVEDSLNYALQAARGLEYAHRHGVIHRDIKPANLLLDSEGVVKVLDMGVARMEYDHDGNASTAANLTSTDTIMGTVDYMAPEQARSAKQADGRSDIYSLGCTLYYLLTGKTPYAGVARMEILLAHFEQPVPSLGDVAGDVQAIFEKMVAKQPADRYQSMKQVVAALEERRSRAPGNFQSKSQVEKVLPGGDRGRIGKYRGLIGAAAAGFLLLLLALSLTRPKIHDAPPAIAVDEPDAVREQPSTPVGQPDKPAPWPRGPYQEIFAKYAAEIPGIRHWDIGTVQFSSGSPGFKEVAVSPDGQHLAFEDNRGFLRICNSTTLEIEAVRKIWGSLRIAWSRDGRWLAFSQATQVRAVQTFDVQGRSGPTLQLEAECSALSWSPQGRLAVVTDNALHVWELTTAFDSLFLDKLDAAGAKWVDWSPDGNRLAVTTLGGEVRIWEADGTPGPKLPNVAASMAAQWHPDSDRLAVGDKAGAVHVLSLTSGASLDLDDLRDLGAPVEQVAWSPDGESIAAFSGKANEQPQRLCMWRADGSLMSETTDGFPVVISLAWSPDSQQLAVGHFRFGRIYDLKLRAVKDLPIPKNDARYGLQWLPDNRLVAADTFGHGIWILKSTGEPLTNIAHYAFQCRGLSWNPRTGDLASVHDVDQVRLWNSAGFPLGAFRSASDGCAWNPQGTQLATVKQDRALIPANKAYPRFRDELSVVGYSLAWQSDGEILAILEGGQPYLFNKAGKQLRRLNRPEKNDAQAVAFNPISNVLASSHADGTIIIWDKNGTPRNKWQAHAGLCRVLVWRPDGKYLASGGVEDKRVCVWDAEGNLQWSQVPAGDVGVGNLTWKPDSTQLAATAGPLFLFNFNADAQRPLPSQGTGAWVERCLWSPNERQIAVTGHPMKNANEICLFDVATNSYDKTMVLLKDGKSATFSTTGELLDGDPEVVDREFFYLAEFDDGQTRVMKPSAFIRMANEALATGEAALPPPINKAAPAPADPRPLP